MYSKTPALFFLSLCAVPGVVRAESGLYFPGATLTLLVFYNRIFEADAAPHKLRRSLSNFFRRTSGKNGSTTDNGTVKEPGDERLLTRDVKRNLKSVGVTFTINAINLGNTGLTADELKPDGVHMDSKGQAGVRKALLWRGPPSPGSNALDGICKEGQELLFQSKLDSTWSTVTRTSRTDNDLTYINIQHPDFGPMTLRPTMLSESDALDPSRVTPFLSNLESYLSPPWPLGARWPSKIQMKYGLLTPLDMYRLPGKYLPDGVEVPGKVVYNMFFLHTPIECTMDQLIKVMNEQVTESRRRTAYQARLSMTVQVLSILGKLRKVHLVPPRLDAESFVITPTGDVLLEKYTPLLSEMKSYLIYSDGSIGRYTEPKKVKKGFSRFSDGGHEAVPYTIDTRQPDRDAADVLLEIWCPAARSGLGGAEAAAAAVDAGSLRYPFHFSTAGSPPPVRMSSLSEDDNSVSEAEPLTAGSPAPSAMSTSSDGEGAAGLVSIDWNECPDAPDEVQRIFDGLREGYITLADVASLHDFKELYRSVKAPSSPPRPPETAPHT